MGTYSLHTVTLFTSQFLISGRPQDKKGDRSGCFLGGCGKESWKPGLVSVGLVYMFHSTWYRKVTSYMTVISGYIWQFSDWISSYLCCLRQVLIMNILIFPPVFTRSSPCPHQSDLNYLSPSTNVLFWLDWMCLGWMWGFPMWLHFLLGNKYRDLRYVPLPSWEAASLGSSSLQTALSAELGLAGRTGAGHGEECREGDSYHPEELCPWKGRGLCHSLLLSSVWFCEHQEYLCAHCWGHRQQHCWHRSPSRGL